jgi:hypothetical protein
MIVSRSSSDVRRVRGSRPDRDVWVTGYMGKFAGTATPGPDEAPRTLFPDAYLIDQGPGVVLGAHFHRANQFQVIVDGSGTLGRKPVRPFVVHYAGAFTPYGPIDPGPQGIGYMTLRARYDPGFQRMPEEREALRGGNRKPRAHTSGPLEPGASPVPVEPVCEAIFGPEPDGLAALRYRIPAGTSTVGLDPAGGHGQYWLVLDGEMRTAQGKVLPPKSCVFISADEPAQRIESASTTPLDLLVMQFPIER